MQPARIFPDLQASILCEEVRQEINGNFFIIGVINYVHVPQLPVTANRICLFNRWTAGIGNFTESVRIVAPDQTTVLRQAQLQFSLQDVAQHATNVTFFSQIKFEVEGTYYVEVSVEDMMKLRFPLLIRIVQPPPGQTPQPQKPPQ